MIKSIKIGQSFMLYLLDSSREADDGEKEAVNIEVFKHALNWVAVDTEGDTGHAQIQTATDDVICSQRVCTGRGHLAGYGT